MAGRFSPCGSSAAGGAAAGALRADEAQLAPSSASAPISPPTPSSQPAPFPPRTKGLLLHAAPGVDLGRPAGIHPLRGQPAWDDEEEEGGGAGSGAGGSGGTVASSAMGEGSGGLGGGGAGGGGSGAFPVHGELTISSAATAASSRAFQRACQSLTPDAAWICYKGGDVLAQPNLALYLVWYGDWDNDRNGGDSGRKYIRHFINNLGMPGLVRVRGRNGGSWAEPRGRGKGRRLGGGISLPTSPPLRVPHPPARALPLPRSARQEGLPSPNSWWQIVRQYADRAGVKPGAQVTIKGEHENKQYSQGRHLGADTSSVFNIVIDAINAGALPFDPAGAYVVLTSDDVTLASADQSQVGGWVGRGEDGEVGRHARTGRATFSAMRVGYVPCGFVARTHLPPHHPCIRHAPHVPPPSSNPPLPSSPSPFSSHSSWHPYLASLPPYIPSPSLSLFPVPLPPPPPPPPPPPSPPALDPHCAWRMAQCGQSFCGVKGKGYCGWHHQSGVMLGPNDSYPLTFTHVGNAATQCAAGCIGGFGTYKLPNSGFWGVDGIVSILAHELAELVTNPDGKSGWTGNNGEIGDMCSFDFGAVTVGVDAGGQSFGYNMAAADGSVFLIQRLWNAFAPIGHGSCAVELPKALTTPPSSSSTSSQSVQSSSASTPPTTPTSSLPATPLSTLEAPKQCKAVQAQAAAFTGSIGGGNCCSGYSDAFVRVPWDLSCSSFCVCVGGVASFQVSCPPGTIFDSARSLCSAPSPSNTCP
ncbi:unnamed protein product [Closterium sp. Naga37s-1]|nr:unnamed protein product [Closterium sp. Naga37s-1]